MAMLFRYTLIFFKSV